MDLSLFLESISEAEINKRIKIIDSLHGGRVRIEFMNDPKLGKHYIVEFGNPEDKKDKINYYFNHHKNKRIQHFRSALAIKSHIKDSLFDIYGADMKAVYREIFNPEELDSVSKAIDDIMQEQGAKSLSLSHEKSRKGETETGWDIQVEFKRSSQAFVEKGKRQIHPILTRRGRPAQVINPYEIEKPMKKRELKNFLSSP